VGIRGGRSFLQVVVIRNTEGVIRHGLRDKTLRSYTESMPRSKHTNTELRKRVAQHVRQARLARGWSQERRAEALGVSVESVSRYECGKLALSLEMIALAADRLNVPLERLVGDRPAGLSPDETELIEGWRRLGVRGQRAVLDVVRWGSEAQEDRVGGR
jgi:transcriptional regulator with XRE-family HTH domain